MVLTLEQGIQKELEKQGVPAGQVQELILDNKVKATAVQGLTDFTSLQSLSLSCCQLRKLSPGSFPTSLTSLVLSDNAIAGGLEVLAPLAQLRHLDVAGNRLFKLEQLSPLTALTSLESLDIEGCPLEEIPDCTSKVFEMLAVLPAFQYLNGMDKLGNEKVVDEEVDGEEEEDDEYEEEAEGGEEGEEGGEEGQEEQEAGEGEEGGDVGGAAGDDGGDDDDGGDEEAGGDDDADDDEEGEQEELGTEALLRQDLEDDEEEYEEEDEPEDEELDEDDEEPSARKRKRGTREYGESDYEEEDDDSDEDYEGED